MPINLDYLRNCKAKNLKGELGTVTEVSPQTKGCHVVMNFDSGRQVTFCFCVNGNYITRYLTFTDKSVQDRLLADVGAHRSAIEMERLVAKGPNDVTKVTTYYAYDEDDVIRFGKTHEIYGDFSNFRGATTYDGRQYKCSEAAWQSLKTLDMAERDEFTSLSGSAAKKKGRSVKLRPDWEQVKYPLMVDVCYAKFSQNPELKALLLSTGDSTLIENTTGWHDNYWGDCNCPRCMHIPGQNHLGMALMRVREQLRHEP